MVVEIFPITNVCLNHMKKLINKVNSIYLHLHHRLFTITIAMYNLTVIVVYHNACVMILLVISVEVKFTVAQHVF